MTEFKLMLASVCDPAKLVFPKLASPKLDGIRCTIRNGTAISRNGKPIRNKFVQSIIGNNHLNGLDGELMVGDPTATDAFRKATSGIMSEDGEPKFTFMVFDYYHPELGFSDRLHLAKEMVQDFGVPKYVKIVPHKKVKDLAQLDVLEEKWLEDGYEGVMLRSLDGPYKLGRSSVTEGHLLKVKRFSDAEATIVSYVEEIHGKTQLPKNSLGKFMCRTPEGIEFGVGGGYTAQERKEFWEKKDEMIGLTLKYKYFTVGMKDAPRFPTFLGIRDENDMS
jgi:DNA ligase-1